MKKNWHTADIIAALHRKKLSLSEVSRQAGLSSSTLANALTRPWPRGEKLIADALNMAPQDIWPERYFDEHGSPVTRRIRKR